MVLSLSKVVFQKGIINSIILCFLIISFICCKNQQEVLPFYNTPDFTAEWINPKDANYASIHTIDTFTLMNQLGHTITKDSLDGNIYIANFFFTSCTTICPKMTNNISSLQEEFQYTKNVKLVSFSVTPEDDTVAKLQKYGTTN